jgi:hypothetical protein
VPSMTKVSGLVMDQLTFFGDEPKIFPIFGYDKNQNMKTTFTISLILMLLAPLAMRAQMQMIHSPMNGSDWSLQQNLGQLYDDAGTQHPEIYYYGALKGVKVYCLKNKISFVFTKYTPETKTNWSAKLPLVKQAPVLKKPVATNCVDMVFENANPNVTISAEDRQGFAKNFINGSHSLYGIQSYKKLIYDNIYSNIDLVLFIKPGGLEYEFIVHPGGKVSDIKITREGMDKMDMLENGGIRVASKLGYLTESSPKSYTGNLEIKSSFIHTKNSTSFKTSTYDTHKDLVIDPDLTWATYYGGSDEDETEGITLDASGNVYIIGSTKSSSGIATSGSHQSTYTGNYDVFVAKFNSSGALQWGTYFGGSADDVGVGIAADALGNLYITGFTQSTSGIATSGAWQTALGGSASNDAFVAKLTNTGSLVWSTYFGGSQNENGYSIAVDAGNNPILFGYTSGSSNLATAGAHQTAFAGGGTDAFLAKYNSKGSLKWSTYFGGKGYDAGYGVSTDATGNIYITGVTTSPKGIATAGAYKTIVDSVNGNAFLSKFDSTGKNLWGTYFGGTNGDAAYFLATNPSSGDVVLTGTTGSYSGIATNGAWQSALNGSNNTFLADFNNKGALQWGTYYGGDGSDVAYGIACDNSGNIYVTGGTTSSTGIATSGAFQTKLGSIYSYIPDAFMAKFTAKGMLKYGTYLGSDSQDVALAIAADNSGNIYITGGSNSPKNIATSGAYQTAYGGGSFDAFLAKFYLCNLTAKITGASQVCPNATTFYKAESHTNSAYVWTVTGGKILSGANTDSIQVQWTGTGAGTVKLKEVNSLTSCLDSIIMSVFIDSRPAPYIFGSQSACINSKVTYNVLFDPVLTYQWNVTNGTIQGSSTLDSVVITWPNTVGAGKLVITEKSPLGCYYYDTLITKINAANAGWKVTNLGKGTYKFSSLDSSMAASGYSWNLGDGAKATGYHVTHTYTHDKSYLVQLSITNPAGCPGQFDSTISVTNTGIETAIFNASDFMVYPNPMSGSCRIQFTLPENAHVALSVCDITGKEIIKLEERTLEPGQHSILWDNSSQNIQPGTYLLKLNVNGEVFTRQVVKMIK